MGEIQFDFLANRKNDIDLVASWMFAEWCHLRPDRSYEELCKQFHSQINTKSPPLHIVAIQGDQTIGVAALKHQEIESYPKDSYWLGDLVVDKPYRGHRVGNKLALEICHIAKSRSIKKLYLQTESLDGGLYKQLGWTEIEVTKDRGETVLVMEKYL